MTTATATPGGRTPAAGRKETIFLTGFMGCGKSTIGPILANTLGFAFIDVDKEIERIAGMTVLEIFRDGGEDRFRAIERDVLAGIGGADPSVVSLGGGTIANDANFRLLHAKGVIVYLHVPEPEIYKRVEHRPDRPLLHDADGALLKGDALREKIRSLYEAREPFYRRADLIVPSHDRKVGYTVDAIVAALRKLPA